MIANILEFFTESSDYAQVKNLMTESCHSSSLFSTPQDHNFYLLLLLIAYMCK